MIEVVLQRDSILDPCKQKLHFCVGFHQCYPTVKVLYQNLKSACTPFGHCIPFYRMELGGPWFATPDEVHIEQIGMLLKE